MMLKFRGFCKGLVQAAITPPRTKPRRASTATPAKHDSPISALAQKKVHLTTKMLELCSNQHTSPDNCLCAESSRQVTVILYKKLYPS